MRSITLVNKDYTLEVSYEDKEDILKLLIRVDDETVEFEMEKEDALGLVDVIKQVLE